MFFKRKQPIKSEESKKDSFLDEYLSTKNDIKSLEEKYDDYILRSLEIDFDSYKQFLDSKFPNLSNLPTQANHWMISPISNTINGNSFTLIKTDNIGSIIRSITINVHFNFFDDNFELKYLHVVVNGTSVRLDTKKFQIIIEKYFMYFKLLEIKSVRDNKRASFESMVDIVGKDIKRDSVIDKILS